MTLDLMGLLVLILVILAVVWPPLNQHKQKENMTTPQNTYVDRTFPTAPAAGYNAIGGSFTIEQSDDSVGYFYATQFGFKNASAGAGGAYMGLQTQLNTQGGLHRGAIFSIFGANNATSRTGADVVHSTELGSDFWSVRCWYPWTVGNTYECVVQLWATDVWRFSVNCITPTFCSETEVGFISVPSTWDGIADSGAVQWTELYTPITSCTFPVSKCTFYRPYVRPATLPGNLFCTSSNPHLQTGTTCTNSGIIVVDSTNQYYREIMGATS